MDNQQAGGSDGSVPDPDLVDAGGRPDRGWSSLVLVPSQRCYLPLVLGVVDLVPSAEPFESAPRCMEATLRHFQPKRTR